MTEPNPIDFGAAAMAAALGMSEDEFREAYRRGDVGPPDSVRFGGGRWSMHSLGTELAKIYPPHLLAHADGGATRLKLKQALNRAHEVEQKEREERRRGGTP